MKTAQDHDAPLRLIEATVAVNEQRKRAMGRKVLAAIEGPVRGRAVALLGLTFKPNTDDMRDAPSIAIIQTLQARSEENTSELQSLMRTSYAVFCLKKTMQNNNHNTY